VFRKKLVFSSYLTIALDQTAAGPIEEVLQGTDSFARFQAIVDVYADALG